MVLDLIGLKNLKTYLNRLSSEGISNLNDGRPKIALKKFKLNEGGSPMTWKRFKNNTNLIEATKEIAALKFQEYILRKISDGTGLIEKSDAEGKIKTEQKIQEDVDSL